MLFKRVIATTLLVIVTTGCSVNTGANIDAEPALAVLGGMMLSLRDDGRIALNDKHTDPLKDFLKTLNPVKEAFAAVADCPEVQDGYCDDTGPFITRDGDTTTMAVFYDNCQTPGFERAGYWHSLVTYKFPTNTECTAVKATGFTGAGLAALAGKTIYKRWGLSQAGNQENVRVGENEEVAYFYSDFPSGWKSDEEGGLKITFNASDTSKRTVEILGVHALGINHTETPVPDPNSFDLMSLSTDLTDPNITKGWDHTINTVTTNDLLFQIGPDLKMSGGRPYFDGLHNNTRATFDGAIQVDGNTVARGATFRVQHNISESLGVLVVTEPLVYSDPTCCYPMSGTVKGSYDRNLRAPTLDETVVFTGTSCGAIKYTNIVLDSVDKTLSHCF
ncbi:hypothetical protein K2X33_06275 [bacterium]|nr:hypothetical protein [bacterium]